ncbi:MAG: hypothetical protein LBF88_02015 [Planctomycetaceae bacterium]|jgi:hypothetical protein|nr:hypothetical protein [Planctomycetaceae bacterium]
MVNNYQKRPLPPINISVLGDLYKDGPQGVEEIRFAIDDTKDKENNITKSALEKANAVLLLINNTIIKAGNGNYWYKLPDFNCVDQVVEAMNTGSLNAPDNISCKVYYELLYRHPTKSYISKKFKLDLSCPHKFIEFYKPKNK